MSMIGPQPYADFYMRVGDKDFYGIDWTGWLENQWPSGSSVALNAVVRPSAANGFEYLCTQAGQTADQEPQWPLFTGSTVTDGGVVWTCQAASNASLTTTVASVVWTPPAGIAVGSQSLIGQQAAALIDATSSVV